MSETKTSMPGIQAAHIKSIDPTTEAADVFSWMALIPLITGYAPNKWKKGIDSMIPKKKNEWRPEKLHLILLMDARFNHNNKFIGRKLMNVFELKSGSAKFTTWKEILTTIKVFQTAHFFSCLGLRSYIQDCST
jgi:hypothetical protein